MKVHSFHKEKIHFLERVRRAVLTDNHLCLADMTEEPQLLLQDLQTLEVTQIAMNSSLEVVMIRPDDGSIFEELACTGAGEGGGACNVTTDLADEEEVHNMLVLLDDAGYVTQSRIVPFEGKG